jgi:6,7-dimethyl-8-ribityllumazine synthase
MNSNHFEALNGNGLRIAIVGARFNQDLCDALVEDALAGLLACQVRRDHIQIVRVPGSFELSVAASRLAETEEFDAIICLGVLIKGDTKHDQYIAQAVAQGLTTISLQTGIPVAFGVLTTETREQAETRALGSKKKGWEAAFSAVETVLILKKTT